MARLTALLTALSLLSAALPARADSPEEQLAAASALFDAKRFEEAAKRLDIYLASFPGHEKAQAAAVALGRSRAELRQWPAAVTAYERAARGPDAPLATLARLGVGEAGLYAHAYDKSAAALEVAVQAPLRPAQAAAAWYWLGQDSYALGKYAPALAAYERLLKEHGSSEFAESATFGAGAAALRLGKLESATTYLRTVADKYKKSEDRPQALLLLAQMDLDAKRFKEARAGLEAVLQEQMPADVKAQAEDALIAALLESGDFAAAAPRIEAALTRLDSKDPHRASALLSLGHARYRLKQYEAARAAYADAAKTADESGAAEALYWAANSELALGHTAQAAAGFAAAADRSPGHALAPKSRLKAADALAAASQPEAAAAAYRLLLDRYAQSPQATEARKGLADLTASVGDAAQLSAVLKNVPPADRAAGVLRLARMKLEAKSYSEVGALLTELLVAHPAEDEAAEASYLMGLAAEAQKQAAQAASAYSSALARKPSAAWAGDAQGRLAWLRLELKQPAEAEKAAGAALAMKLEPPAEEQARLALIQAQVDQQKWDGALEGCRTVLAGKPSEAVAASVLHTRAWVTERTGKADDALPLWAQLAADYPKSAHAADALMRLGDASMKAEKYEEARARYAAVVATSPSGPLALEARFKEASALFSLDRAAEAAAEFDAVAADKASGSLAPEALYWSGVALDKAGRKDDALQRLSRLVEQYPANSHLSNARIRIAAIKALLGR